MTESKHPGEEDNSVVSLEELHCTYVWKCTVTNGQELAFFRRARLTWISPVDMCIACASQETFFPTCMDV